MKKPLFILIALALGVCFPYFERFQFVIRYFLMTILFFSFLNLRLSWQMYTWRHLGLVVGSVGLALLIYYITLPLGESIAQSAFLVAIAPTAIAAIIFADLFKVDLAFVTAAVIISNLATIITIPIAFTYLLETAVKVNVFELLQAVGITIVVPLVAAQLIVRSRSRVLPFLMKLQWFAFSLFVCNIFIASAKASHFLQYESESGWESIAVLIATMAVLCIFLFQIGKLFGGKTHQMAASLSLGRKNTMFTIWLATAYLEPIILIAPTAYILLQNVYNAWQLARKN